MRNSKFFKVFTLSVLAFVMCASRIQADPLVSVNLGGSNNLPINVSITPGVPNDPNNPNQFPVVFIETAAGFYGFLLDGSELAKAWLDKLEVARANNLILRAYYDPATTNGYVVPISIFGANNTVSKIWYLSTSSVVF